MENKIMQVFYGNDCLPYKDKERQVHYPIVGNAFLGASNTTKIRFYFDYIGNVNTTWVSVAKLPNGKQGSKVLPISSDDNGNYAELELSNWYTQAKGDVYIALQGYQGGVEYSYDSETELYEIHGTPTIQTTGSIKLAINYAPIGDSPDYTDEFTTYQEILAALGDKASLESVVLSVDLSDYPTYQDLLDYVGTRPFAFILNDELRFGVFKHDSENDTYALKIFDNSGTYVTNTLNLSDSTSTIEQEIAQIEFATDNIIELTSLIGTLTNKQLQQAVKDNAYIKYNNNYYRKDIDSGTTEFVRFVVGLANNGTSIQIKKTYFNVNTTSGVYYYGETTYDTYTSTWASNLLNAKQDRLVSGTNIKTINNESILGSGNIDIQGGGGASEWGAIGGDIQDQTDLQNEFQSVRAEIAGRALNISISCFRRAPTTDEAARLCKKFDGTQFTDLADFNAYVSGLTLKNEDFFTDADTISLYNTDYIIDLGRKVIKVTDIRDYYVVGNSNLFIIEQNINDNQLLPDRWYSQSTQESVTFNALESKLNLTNYATQDDLSDAIGSVNDNLAPAYDSSVIYSIGDKVINKNGELVSCLVNMTQAEEYDSTHWSQISVASGFVDLDKAQVISGVKRFSSGIELADTSNTNSPYLYFKNQYATKSIRLNAYNFNIDGHLLPVYNGTINLGTPANEYRFANVYVKNLDAQLLNKNSSNYGLTLPDTTNFTANKVIMTKDESPVNEINASDIVNNTLTQDQLAIFQNGKQTTVKGTFLNLIDPVFYAPGTRIAGVLSRGLYVGHASAGNQQIGTYQIIESTGVISLSNSTQDNIDYNNVGKINGIAYAQYYKKPQASVSLSDGGTITDSTLKTLIQNEQPIKLNGFTCYFSCDDGTNYQYVSTRYDSNANKNHINVITINKSTWVATFHTSDLALS